MSKLSRILSARIDNASLAIFRMIFGAVMIWEVCRYFYYGWIDLYFVGPEFHFKYFGFSWVHPLPEPGMYALFVCLGVCAFCIMVGLCYRISIALFSVMFAYVFLLEKSMYLNHFYLITLISILLNFIPTHRSWSIDSKIWPSRSSTHAPAWQLWLLRFQIAIPYFFGGVAKINPDWLKGEPMGFWLFQQRELPIVGQFMTKAWVVDFFVYGGMFFDLLIVPMLLYRRTRLLACAMLCFFHMSNAHLFPIGIFPWFMLAATTLYFSPDWPRRLLNWASRRDATPAEPPAQTPTRLAPWLTVLLAGYITFQCVMPLRHWLYPGFSSWTKEGYYFAWTMRLNDHGGKARYLAMDEKTRRVWSISPLDYIEPHQLRALLSPHLALQLAHHIADDLQHKGHAEIQVFAEIYVSLNGRPTQLLIDKHKNLEPVSQSLRPAPWIQPLLHELPIRKRS